MQITIQVDNGEVSPRVSSCARFKRLLCGLSVQNFVTLTILLIFLIVTLFFCKTYVKNLLVWLEDKDSTIIAVTIVVLYCLFSLPIMLGYIMLVIADGYLFGFFKGFLLTVVGANIGLIVAHNMLKLGGHHPSIRRLVDNDTARAIMRVISGPLCFKIVFCARLTPIPFGVQNTIFALSNVNGRVYHIASLLGLLAPQSVAVYVGTTLRSMQDVIENTNITTGTYAFAILQVFFGVFLMFWIGAKARNELMKALNDGENQLMNEKPLSSIISM